MTLAIDTERLHACGYCRRCAIHDDPGGCLEVSAYERELVEGGATAEMIWPDADAEARDSWFEETRLHADEIRRYREMEARAAAEVAVRPLGSPYVFMVNEGWGS